MPRLSKIGAAALAAFGWTSGSSVTATYLVVAGGGGGGADEGGGGGGGGYQTSTLSLNPTLSYTVTVGAGGAGGVSGVSRGTSGSDSVFSSVTSTGGGGGGSNSDTINNGLNGGSGGGASTTTSASGVSGTGGTGTVGQGSNGGTGYRTAGVSVAGGGGGGASAAGANASSGVGGNGGAGSTSSISGTSTGYAGGGGGGCRSTAGTATQGGGAGSTSGNASNGTSNLGGGGGGGRVNGGQGGSGIVIISYPGSQQFSGGVVTSSGGNTIHTFTTSGTLGPITTLNASYLIVAGGASGGNGNANIRVYGGGGAGGMLTGSGLTIDPNSTYIVTVGAGGASQTVANTVGYNGSNSSFSAVATTAVGGGNAGSFQSGNGGSGGGGGYDGSLYSPGSGTAGQGNNGGTGTTTGGGGGGGAGAVGGNASGGTGGVGGAGAASSISGTSTYYAGGGGGGGASSNGAGGVGGGGSGSTAGTANTGGGGGGTATNITSGAGGSGIVIISYPGSTQQMAGGTVTITGGNVIHTFTSTGYLAPLKYVGNSLRFRASASAYLNRTPSVAGSQTTWTWSGWVKRGALSSAQNFFSADRSSASEGSGNYFTSSDTLQVYAWNGSSFIYNYITTQVFRDPSAWYHIVITLDTTNATSTDRVRIYVNGSRVTAFGTSTAPSQNATGYINATQVHALGRSNYNTSLYFDGYLTEVNFVDGQALTPNSFGTFNSYGVWQPITYGGSYGTNGFYLPFPNSATGSTLTANFLVVAGGGAGGSNAANGAGTGGGGAGGFRTSAGTSGGGASAESALTLYAAQSYVVTVGAGGAANSGGNLGSNGSNSTFSTITATGGGGGSYANATSGSSGGSGGGSGRNTGGQVGGAGTANQGYAGGTGYNGTPYRGGGGGGAGAVGVDGVTSGNGGAGVSSSITGSAVTYAGGGGGGLFQSGAGGTAGSGGSGGGGAGGNAGSNGTAGTANLGGGGGGGGSTSSTGYNAGAGGSGVVVISYAGPQRYTGGTVTTSGGNTIHTFNSSGVLTSIFNDFSPNGNNWTGNNFDVTNTTASTYDSMTDVPTLTSATAANYPVQSPLYPGSSTITNGNLQSTSSTTTVYSSASSFQVSSGKWYWEVTVTAINSGNQYPFIGAYRGIPTSLTGAVRPGGDVNGFSYRQNGNAFVDTTTFSSSWGSMANGDVIGVALDLTNSQVSFYKNNTLQGTITGLVAGTYTPADSEYNGSSVAYNYGQRPFTYTPPSGFTALNAYTL